jgi:hypothetical protein
MKRTLYATALILAALVGTDWVLGPEGVSAQGDQHAYFRALVQRAEHWKSYSMRDAAQFAHTSEGGYATARNSPWVTYNPAADLDRAKQDAAKVVIPAFEPRTVLTAPLSSNGTVITVQEAYKPAWDPGRPLKIDRETLTVIGWLSDTTVSVTRGAFGTAAVAHAAGAIVKTNTNSLPTQVRMPLLTEDGNVYVFTWDGYWTDSYVASGLTNHKAFQFSSGGSSGDNIWLEPQTRFNGARMNAACWNEAQHIFVVGFRSYNQDDNPNPIWALTDGNQIGPGVVTQTLPHVGNLCVRPNTWVRFWVRLDQRAQDYDYVDAWAADETTEAVQVLRHLPVSVRPSGRTPNQVGKFWLEFNTSTDDHLRLDERDLVSYVRNFVALRNVGNINTLLVRPVPGAQPVPGPAPPRNVRIIS